MVFVLDRARYGFRARGILNSLRDKNIKIRAEVVMFILVCSIAAFNISTAKCNVTLLHKK